MSSDWRATPKVKQAARRLRGEMTLAEQQLWTAIRKRQVAGLRFRRQHPIGGYIVDFCCVKQRLIIEVDGPIHVYTAAYDETRQETLEALGYRIVRVTNEDIMQNLDGVIQSIIEVV